MSSESSSSSSSGSLTPPRLVITPATPTPRFTFPTSDRPRASARRLFDDDMTDNCSISSLSSRSSSSSKHHLVVGKPRSGAVSILFVLFAFVLVTTSALLSSPFTTPHIERMSRFSESVDAGFRSAIGGHGSWFSRAKTVHTAAVHRTTVVEKPLKQESWQAFVQRTGASGGGMAGIDAWDFH